MSTKKTLYFDIETSGLEPRDGAVILSIGAVLDRHTTKDSIQEFLGIIVPTDDEWNKASADALKVNGLTMEYLKANGKPIADVRDDFISWLAKWKVRDDQVMYVGQNPLFDIKFLKYYFGGSLSFIGVDFAEDTVYDTRDFYSILVNRRVVPFIKYRSSENISKGLGVEPEPWPHTALDGAKAVHRNYSKMLELGVRV